MARPFPFPFPGPAAFSAITAIINALLREDGTALKREDGTNYTRE